MGKRGVDRSVSDRELLETIKKHPHRAVKAQEIAEDLPIGATRVHQLLEPLVDNGIVVEKRFGSGKGYWVATESDVQKNSSRAN